MATVNVLNQMAEYDFNEPINVEMIFEDSDNDDPPLQNSLCEQQHLNYNNNNKKQVPDEKSEINSQKLNEISQNQLNNKKQVPDEKSEINSQKLNEISQNQLNNKKQVPDEKSEINSQKLNEISQNQLNNKKQVPDEKSEINSQKLNEISQNQLNSKSLNKSILSLNKNSRILQNLRNPSKEIRQDTNVRNLNNSKNAENIKDPDEIERNKNIFDANPHALVFDNNKINGEERLPGIHQVNYHQEPATFIEDLLNKISENIFLIMQSFHHYGIKIPNKDNKKREEVFNFIKYHFFELSYSTVESILLPQEQNESFINKFIDNTVLIINNKSLQWKCSRRHVLPFFKELMTWTKQKRECIQNNPPPSTSNENILLKQQLVRPLLPLNRTQTEIDANSNGASNKIAANSNGASTEIAANSNGASKKIAANSNGASKKIAANSNGASKKIAANSKVALKKIAANNNGASQSNLCIFSSGPPGKEISINIDVNTLNQINERQQLTVKETEQNGISNSFAQRCESTRRKTPVPSPTYRNRVKHIQKNNPQFDRPAPPAYHATHNSRISYGPQLYSHSHTGQPHQNPSIGQHNYPTQVHYIDTNHTSPSPLFNNYLYNNTNNTIPLHRTQIENRVTSSPVISNVSSPNLNTRMLMFRCYMCGKRATAPCNPYNPPCRLYFCSFLCQELDSQFYKPSWSNT